MRKQREEDKAPKSESRLDESTFDKPSFDKPDLQDSVDNPEEENILFFLTILQITYR